MPVDSKPDDGKVTVTLGGGATRRIPRADAAALIAAGKATPVDSTAYVQREIEDTVQPLSDGPLGGAMASVGGALSGFTGGITDPVLPGAAKSAAVDNPGLYTGGQVVGAVGGALLGAKGGGIGGAGGVAGLTSNLGTRIAGKAGGGVAGAVVGGAVEGGLAGIGNTVSRASLSNDPLTTESVLADIGIGTLFGAGISGLGAAASRAGSRLAKKLAAPAEAEAAELAAIEAGRSSAKSAASAARDATVDAAGGARAAADMAADDMARAVKEGAEGRLAASRRVAEQEAATLRKSIEDAHATRTAPFEADVMRLKETADAAQMSSKAASATLRQTQEASSEAARALRAARLEREAVEKAGSYKASTGAQIEHALDANMERVGVIARSMGDELTAGASESFSQISASSRKAVKAKLAAGDVEGAVELANQWGDMAEAWHASAAQKGRLPAGLGPVPQGGYRVVVETREQFADRVASAVAGHTAAEEAAKKAEAAFKAARQDAADAVKLSQSSAKRHYEAERALALRRGKAAVAIDEEVSKGQAAIQKRIAAEEAAVAKELADAEAKLAKAKASSAKDAAKAVARAEADVAKATEKADRAADAALKAYGGVAKRGGSRPGWLRRTVTGAGRSGAGRAADTVMGGGVKGAMARSVSSSAAATVIGTLMGGPVAGAVVAAEVTGVRSSITSAITRAAAKTLPRGGRVLQKASPALARLMMDETGEPGRGSPEEAALAKMREIAHLSVVGPDASFEAVKGLIEVDPVMAAGVQKKALEINAHLASVMPKSQITGSMVGGPKPRITRRQALEFADHYMAATDPMAAIEYLSDGNINMAMADTLHAVWPSVMKEYTGAVAASLSTRESVSHSQLMAYSVILRQPMHSLHSAENIAYLQTEVHGPKAEAPEPKTPPTFTPGAPPARSTTGSAQPAMTQAQRLQNR